MADILTTAQSSQNPTGSSPPIPPEPPPEPVKPDNPVDTPALKPPAAISDSLIVPPKTDTPPPKDESSGQMKPPESSGKKRFPKGAVLAVILLLLITLPLAVFFIAQQNQTSDLRSRAENVYAGCGTATNMGQCRQTCNANEKKIDAIGCGSYICCTIDPSKTNGKCCPLNASAGAINTCMGIANSTDCNYQQSACSWVSGTGAICPAVPDISPTPTGIAGCSSIKNYSSSTNVVCNHYNGSQISSQGTFTGNCAFYHCPNGCTGTCGEGDPGVQLEFGPCNSGKLSTSECGQMDTVDNNNAYCAPVTGCDTLIQCGPSCQRTSTSTPMPTVTSTPTATSTPGPQCTRIRFYYNGTEVTDFSTLKGGDVLTITVDGTLSSKAQVRVNGSAWTETSTKNAEGAFTVNLTLPIPTIISSSITVEAQTFGTDGQWH